MQNYTEELEIFRQLLDLCESRGYNPVGASLQKTVRYRGLSKYNPSEKVDLIWALTWECMVGYKDYGPDSGDDHPAILFLSGREEWHSNGRLHRRGDAAVITSNGTRKFFINDIEVKTVEDTLTQNPVPTLQ